MTLEKKEKILTVVFLIVFILAGHMGLWFVLFPVSPSTRFLGFPLHYTIALIVGWPGILLLAFLYARIANRLDDEIASAETHQGEAE